MAKTFKQMVDEAKSEVPVLSPEEAQRRMQEDPNTLVLDVRDPSDVGSTGIIPGATNVSLGTLPYKADQESDSRDDRLQDHDQPVITTCKVGGQAALAAKLLKDMGFKNVSAIEGGTQGWKAAGLPTEQPRQE